MGTTAPIRLVIADDHFVVRQGLVGIIEQEKDMKVVGQAADGEEAVEIYGELLPDVLLLDLRMPRRDGFAVLKELKPKFPGIRAIVTTSYESEEGISRSFKLGAKSYLTKDVTGPVLVETIRQVHGGKSFVPESVALKLIDNSCRTKLSERERETLSWIARGLSNKEIGSKLFICEGTVKSHVKKLLAKLEVKSRSQAVVLGCKIGLIELN